MSLWSDLNGNLGKVSERAASVNIERNRVKGPGNDLLVDPADLGKANKKASLLVVIAIGIVMILGYNIITKMAANDSLDAFTVTVTNNGSTIELFENPLKMNAYEGGVWIYGENPSISEKLLEVVPQLPVVVWDEAFEMKVPDGTTLKWFDIYDETHACIRRFAEENEVNEFLADAEPATYYVVAGASWKGKYVLKSFTNESFTSEFCVRVLKK